MSAPSTRKEREEHWRKVAISNYWLQTLTGVSLFCGSVLGLAAPGTSWYMGTFEGATAGNRDGSFSVSGKLWVAISGYRYEVLCVPKLGNCDTGFEQYIPSVGGAIFAWVGGIVLMVSAVMAFSAGLRLQQFADGDVAPIAPRTRAETGCLPSTVTINWLNWIGFIFYIIGLVWMSTNINWTNSWLTYPYLSNANFWVYAEGLPLMLAATILVLLAVLLESVASCKLRGFPGIGAAPSGCCGVALEETVAEDAPTKA